MRVVQLAIGLKAEWRLTVARPIKIADFSRSPMLGFQLILEAVRRIRPFPRPLFIGRRLVREFERKVKNCPGALILLDFRTIPKYRRWIIAQVCAATK